jgi:hypothetical protein
VQKIKLLRLTSHPIWLRFAASVKPHYAKRASNNVSVLGLGQGFAFQGRGYQIRDRCRRSHTICCVTLIRRTYTKSRDYGDFVCGEFFQRFQRL